MKHRNTIIAALAVLPLCAAGPAPDGFHAEVFAGMTTFDTTTSVGGVKLIDQGGDAPVAGFRAGYGKTFGRLYLGVEGDVFAANGRSRAMVNGATYSYEPRGAAGAYARVGVVSGGALLYARGGVQVWDSNHGTRGVPAVGAGAEVPFGRWYGRVDVTYSWSGIEAYQGTIGIGRRF